MKTSRLTNSIRDKIIADIVNDSFDKRHSLVEKKRHRFSVKVYNDIYSAAERKKMDALPKGWLPERDHFTVQFGEKSSGFCRRQLEHPKRFLSKHDTYNCIKVYAPDHPFSIEHEEITREHDSLRDERHKVQREVSGIVYSHSSAKKLLETWPEIEKYVKRHQVVESQSTALAPKVDGLNKALNLKRSKLKSD